MLVNRMKQHERQEPTEANAMVTAVLGAVADFAEPPEEKLKAIIQAGRIAEAFFCEPAQQHSATVDVA